MHDDNAIAREVNVELEPVGAERDSVLKGGECIFWRQCAPAPVSEHERTGGSKE